MTKLLIHVNEIEKWNHRMNLVKASGSELIIRHVLDSLAALPFMEKMAPAGHLVDLGSGAGFPGIPLAVMQKSGSVTLVERSSRRSDFLRNTALLLELGNLLIQEVDIKTVTETFDIVTFRALAPIPRIIDNVSRLTRRSGFIAAYKGQRIKIDEEMEHLAETSMNVRIVPIQVPFLGEERHLVVIRPIR